MRFSIYNCKTNVPCNSDGTGQSGEPAGSGKCPPAELSVSGEQARGTFSMPPDAESGRELYPGIAFSLIVILTSVLMPILPAAAAYSSGAAASAQGL